MSTRRVRDDDASCRRRTIGHSKEFSSNPKSLSEYAVYRPPPPDDEWEIESKDENLAFFQKGRDYQPNKEKHHFTEEEKEILGTYESAATKPSHTAVYRKWVADLPPRTDSESWIVVTFIAVVIGVISFSMKMVTEHLHIFNNPFVKDFVETGEWKYIWCYFTVTSCLCGVLSAIFITYISPQAGGSGVPEIIGILNGCVVRKVLTLKTLVCKFCSCVFTVISGLPVGFEGPMIHIGAMVAGLMARPCRCQTEPGSFLKKDACCKKSFKKICRYRDCEERQNLICVGTAAGVSSAFSSPITGLCFAMEEMSTHWSSSLTWQTFVCCIIARSTTELLHTFKGTLHHKFFMNQFNISFFEMSESALFDMKLRLNLHFAVLIPAMIIGIVGGLLGALYIFLHLKMARGRRRILNCIGSPKMKNIFKIVEVWVLCIISSSVIMTTMPFFHCLTVNHSEPVSREVETRYIFLRSFDCPEKLVKYYDKNTFSIVQEGQQHEGASLLLTSWEQSIRNLFSRRTPDFFNEPCLLFILIFFFIFSSWAAMVSIASGLLIPQLAIGALFGRLVGKCAHDLFREHINALKDQNDWDFIDPGALALLGSASFLAGTSRLPITSVIMMAEMTDDINMSLLVMICVMISKFVGDRFTHSLFHSLLEFKCIPILEPELKVYYNNAKVDLELFPVSMIMSCPVKTANIRSSVHYLANLLLETNHGAFPVIKPNKHEENVFMGLISRMELTILLTKTSGFDLTELKKDDIEKIRITYPEYNSTKLKDCAVTNKILQKYSGDESYMNVFINLYPYINLSSHSVTTTFSLSRSYAIFRDLGLRHLVVVNEFNEVEGIVTRKDLLGYSVQEKVHKEISRLTRHHKIERRIQTEAKELQLSLLGQFPGKGQWKTITGAASDTQVLCIS